MDQGVPYPRGKAGVENHPAGVGANIEGVRRRYKELVRVYHPDTPTGDAEEMTRINQAYAVLMKELPSRPDSFKDSNTEPEEARRYEKAKHEPPVKPPHVIRREAEAEARAQAHKMAEQTPYTHTSPERREAQERSMRRMIVNLRKHAEQQRSEAEARRTAEQECPIKRQLKAENGGTVLRQDSAKAKEGTWW